MVKNWIPRYLSMQEEFENLCSTHKEIEAMDICSRDTETVVRDQSFFMDFIFVCGGRGNNLPINLFLSSWQTGWYKFQACAEIHS